MQKFKVVGISLIALYLMVVLSFIGGGVYVVSHFVTKFW